MIHFPVHCSREICAKLSLHSHKLISEVLHVVDSGGNKLRLYNFAFKRSDQLHDWSGVHEETLILVL